MSPPGIAARGPRPARSGPGRRGWRATLALLLLATAALGAWAHKPSDSYLTVDAGAEPVRARWDIALRDLDQALALDADGDGALTWGELRRRHDEIAAYALAGLTLRRGDQPCTARVAPQALQDHTDGAYTVLTLAFDCGGAATAGQALSLRYTLFAELDAQHRGLLQWRDAAGTRSVVLGPAQPEQRFDAAAPAGIGLTLWHYLREGVWHIWIGLDHVLFLLALLLPAVLVRERGRWRPAPSLRAASWDVVKVVTAFTLAHSLTLSAAVLGWLAPPSRLVESVIALSVVAAALNNLWPRVAHARWGMAFGFGLVHGFGFASVLVDLGLPGSALAASLLGFNAGVELGQLAIVAVFVPLAFVLRHTAFYRRVLMLGGSLAVALLAAAWFVERAFGVELLRLGL